MIFMVSLPKISATFTAIFRLPGLYSINALFSSRNRFFWYNKIYQASFTGQTRSPFKGLLNRLPCFWKIFWQFLWIAVQWEHHKNDRYPVAHINIGIKIPLHQLVWITFSPYLYSLVKLTGVM